MSATDRAQTTRHVLVIDDDPGVRFVLGEMVRRLGFASLLAGNGREGLDLQRAHAASIDCTLVDVTMAEWDGAETRARIRAEFPRAAVLLMSGRVDGRGNAGDFLCKPFTLRELERALSEASSVAAGE